MPSGVRKRKVSRAALDDTAGVSISMCCFSLPRSALVRILFDGHPEDILQLIHITLTKLQITQTVDRESQKALYLLLLLAAFKPYTGPTSTVIKINNFLFGTSSEFHLMPK